MPRFDGTGPEGAGARTGRGLGICSTGLWGPGGLAWTLIGTSASGIARRFFGRPRKRGFGAGLGRGLGLGRNQRNRRPL